MIKRHVVLIELPLTEGTWSWTKRFWTARGALAYRDMFNKCAKDMNMTHVAFYAHPTVDNYW